MLTEYDQQHLDELMDLFDFAKVATAMQAVGWQWVNRDGERYIPDERQLRKRVRQMAQQAIKQALTNTGHAPGKGFYGTGGFHIEAEAKGGQIDFVWVRFVLEEWDTTHEDE